MLNQVRLSLIVVTYNSQDTIKECLESLISQVKYPDNILVYDNGSLDGTIEVLNEYKDKLSLYISSNNSGFSYACNWCADKASNATHLAFINPDTVIQPNLVDRARENFINDDVGLIGFSCKDQYGDLDKNFRRYPGIFSGLLTIIDNVIHRFNIKHTVSFDLKKHYLDGSCMFVKRDLFFNANKFQDFFLYGEDVILCNNLKQAGIKAVYYYDIFYLHFRGGSLNSIPGERSWSMLPNMYYSELYYLRSLGMISKLVYLILKFVELLSLIFVSRVFISKDKMKLLFFKKKLKLLFKYSLSFLIQGNHFVKPEFHKINKNDS